MKLSAITLKEEKQQLNEWAPIVWAIGTAIVASLAVDIAMDKILQWVDGMARKGWKPSFDEVPRGTRFADRDGNVYQMKARPSDGAYVWMKKGTGGNWNMLGTGSERQIIDALAPKLSWAASNNTIDFSEVSEADFNRAYGMSKINAMDPDSKRSYAELNDLYEKEMKRTNGRIWRFGTSSVDRWAKRAGIAFVIINGIGMYIAYEKTYALVQVYKRRLDEGRFFVDDSGRYRKYTSEDYDENIDTLRRLFVVQASFMFAQMSFWAFANILIKYGVDGKRQYRNSRWWQIWKKNGLIKAGKLATGALGAVSLASVLSPQFRDKFAVHLFDSFLVDTPADYIGNFIDENIVDLEDAFVEIGLGHAQEQSVSDSESEEEDMVPTDGDNNPVTSSNGSSGTSSSNSNNPMLDLMD